MDVPRVQIRIDRRCCPNDAKSFSSKQHPEIRTSVPQIDHSASLTMRDYQSSTLSLKNGCWIDYLCNGSYIALFHVILVLTCPFIDHCPSGLRNKCAAND
jgi:hypothetical protein